MTPAGRGEARKAWNATAVEPRCAQVLNLDISRSIPIILPLF